MKFREDIDAVMDRVARFSTNGKTGDALVTINADFSTQKPSVKGLNQWRFPHEMEAFLDESVKVLEAFWQGRQVIADDLIPMIYPRYGIAEHSAFVGEGTEVEFSTDTSYPHPILQDYEDMDKLVLREDNQWLRLVIDGLAYLRERGDGRFAVMLRGMMAPMDLANALRGNDMFEDIYENPDELHQLLSFCVEAGEWYISRQKKVVGDFHGGTLIGLGFWMPGNAIGHLSEDASVLCAPDTYREFGKPYTEKLIAPYDSANMHLHTAGAHAFEHITAIDKLQSFELAPDPNQPRGIEVYKQKHDLFGNRIMRLFVTFDEIKDNIAFLKEAKTILHCDANSIEEAQAIVALIRKELPVL